VNEFHIIHHVSGRNCLVLGLPRDCCNTLGSGPDPCCHLVQRFNRDLHALDAGHDLIVGLLHGIDRVPAGIGDAPDHIVDILGGILGPPREVPHFSGDDSESTPGFPCPGSLDRGIQGKEVGLVGDIGDDFHDIADLLGLFIKRDHLLHCRLREILDRIHLSGSILPELPGLFLSVQDCPGSLRHVLGCMRYLLHSTGQFGDFLADLFELLQLGLCIIGGLLGGGGNSLGGSCNFIGPGEDIVHRLVKFFHHFHGVGDKRSQPVNSLVQVLFHLVERIMLEYRGFPCQIPAGNICKNLPYL